MNSNKYLILLVSLLLVLWGCSTRRNTWLSRGYQNLTAHYNVLFNGEQSFKEGRDNMREGTRDDFTALLPLFSYSPASGASVASSQMQRAIDKGHKIIEEHSITVKPKRKPARGGSERYEEFYNQREFNRWVDDAWMLVGKGHMYLHEWPEAVYAFEMVLRDFPDHPDRFEALLWMARAYIEAEQMENARLALDRYEREGEAPDRFYSDVMATYAAFWLAVGDYETALPYCTEAALNTSDRWQKIRWNYTLGQVCSELELYARADEAFKQVVKLNPRYEMSFHARVNRALVGEGAQNPEVARQKLEKLLRQNKNLEYRDQLYYALAETWFREPDTLQALTQLKLAAGYSQGNQTLKGKIYLRMADVYYAIGEYIPAHAYYDSSLVMLPTDFERLPALRDLTRRLAPLSAHLTTIQHEDSVQRVAALPADERELFLSNLLAMYQQEEQQGTSFSSTADDAFFFRNFANRGAQSTDEQGNWYFYNPTMVSLGKMEFEKRWGRRALGDNWRRQNKAAQADAVAQDDPEMDMFPPDPPGGIGAGDPGPGAPESAGAARPTRESLEEGLPLTPEKMEASRRRVEDAMYGAGMAFYEQLDKYGEARQMLDDFLEQYPETEHHRQALMTLYLACEKMNDPGCMARHRQLYLEQYPDTRFSRYLSDPQFVEKQQAREVELNRLYKEAYSAYLAGDWHGVVLRTDTVLNGHYEPLKPKAALLKAMARGRSGNTPRFENELRALTELYQGSNAAYMANQWLAMLDRGRMPVKLEPAPAAQAQEPGLSAQPGVPEVAVETGGFALEPDSAHYLLMVLEEKADGNRLLFNIANYNFDRFLLGHFQIKTNTMGDNRQVLTVGPFSGQTIGMDYYYSVRDNTGLFRDADAGGTTLLLVSQSNLQPLLSSADVPAYKAFFLEQYLVGSDASAPVVSDLEQPAAAPVDVTEDASVSLVDFGPQNGAVSGMVVIPSGVGNKQRAIQFLPNYVRNITGVAVSVTEDQLSDSIDVILIEEFLSGAVFEEVRVALAGNPYWNNQLGGNRWELYPVSSANFELLKGQGTLEGFVSQVFPGRLPQQPTAEPGMVPEEAPSAPASSGEDVDATARADTLDASLKTSVDSRDKIEIPAVSPGKVKDETDSTRVEPLAAAKDTAQLKQPLETEIEQEKPVEPQPEPEPDVEFLPQESTVLGMVVIPSSSGNKQRTLQFLPNYVRNIVSLSVSVSEEQLSDGTTLLIVREFPDMDTYEQVAEALNDNPYWGNQLSGRDWGFYPISAPNMELVKEVGRVKPFIDFLNSEEKL